MSTVMKQLSYKKVIFFKKNWSHLQNTEIREIIKIKIKFHIPIPNNYIFLIPSSTLES